MRLTATILALLIVLAGCQSHENADIPGDGKDLKPYAGVADGETLHFTGTELFWSGEVVRGTLTYKTPEKPEGQTITVSSFKGRGGLSYSGLLDGVALALVVTPATCSDGMSDRSYPFVATLQLGDEKREGCAWSDLHPFKLRKAP